MTHGRLACLTISLATLVATPLAAQQPIVHDCPILVIGGSAGGVAAAVAASQLGKKTCLVEETPWLGGQLLTVAELDEPAGYPSIPGQPTTGLTWLPSRPFSKSYRQLREGIQTDANSNYGWECQGPFRDTFDPGNCTSNVLAYPPRMMPFHINQLLSHPLIMPPFLNMRVTSKRLSMDQSTVLGANAIVDATQELHEFHAEITIDATEFGDFIAAPPALIPYRVGVDAKPDTNEEHAPMDADPRCVNPITYPFFLERNPGVFYSTIQKPSNYDTELAPLFYQRPCTTWYNASEDDCGRPDYSFWNWRRTHWPHQFTFASPLEQTQINWAAERVDVGQGTPSRPNLGGNDFNRNCLGGPDNPQGCEVIEGNRQAKLAKARELAQGFAYYVQTQIAPTQGGLTAWRMATSETDAAFDLENSDGISPIPYVRESRRIRAVRTITEQDVSRDQYWEEVGGQFPPPRARRFEDSVGIGHYHLDLHDCAAGDPFIVPFSYCPHPKPDQRIASLPFQIPLGAMVPASAPGTPVEGFLASSKNIGTTHITNGAYRLQPGEWHIGLASGAAAAISLQDEKSPRYMVTNHEPQFGVAERPHVRALRRVQQALVKTLRSPVYWWADVWDSYPDDPSPAEGAKLFEATQMVAADGIMVQLPDQGMNFLYTPTPENPTPNNVTRGIGALIIMRAIHTKTPVDTVCIGTAFVDVECPPPGTPTPWGGHYPFVQALKNDGVLTTSASPSAPACTPSSTHFRPDCPLKRRDWIRFLVRAKGILLNPVPAPHYSDVRPGDPDFAYIDAAWTEGLVDVTSGQFRPNATLVRSEAAIMSYNAIRKYYALD